jgi:type II secretory pathway component PulF
VPTYAYRAKQAPGEVAEGTLDAATRTDAINRLRAMGYSLLSLEEAAGAGGGPLGFSLTGGRRVKISDLALFWRQLASLLSAGLPLARALATAQEQTEGRELARVIGQVRDTVERAASFSDALARFPRVFRPHQVSLIATGEATGRLAEVAERLAAHVEKEHDLRSRVRSALIYPAFLCLVGGVVVGVLVAFVIPKFAMLFANYGQQLPLPTRTLLAVSRFSHQYWLPVIGGMGLVATVAYRLTRRGAGRLWLDTLKLRLPVLGKVFRQIEMARFAHTLGVLCANGVHVLPAFDITSRAMANRVVVREVAQARERISRGARVAAALREGRYFPPALINMVSVGEDSASLPAMLGKVAEVYERESDRVVGAMTRLLEAALIVLLAGVVALVVAAILLPIFRASAFIG